MSFSADGKGANINAASVSAMGWSSKNNVEEELDLSEICISLY